MITLGFSIISNAIFKTGINTTENEEYKILRTDEKLYQLYLSLKTSKHLSRIEWIGHVWSDNGMRKLENMTGKTEGRTTPGKCGLIR